MNKWNKTAYMLLIWTVFTAFSLCGCAGGGKTQMYLEAKTQDGQDAQKNGPETATDAGQTDAPAGSEDVPPEKDEEPVTCFVYVCGAVKHPGVYELPQGSRVYEAVALAGGMCKNAYTKEINQAKQIEDGEMIEVLTVKEHKEQETQPQGAREQEVKSQGTDGQADVQGLIDINTATAQQLMALSGIGEAKAANIIAYRESNGRFSSTQELMNVNGIGEGVYARIKDKITVTQ